MSRWFADISSAPVDLLIDVPPSAKEDASGLRELSICPLQTDNAC